MQMERNNSASTHGLSRWNVDSTNNSNKRPCESVITKQINGDFMSSSDPIITGLRLSRRKEYGDEQHNNNYFPGISTSANPIAKRSRASYQNMQNPCCQVEGCNLDLKSAKDYHRRHRICESHSKSPRVIVSGMERRFCQQCSRFHDLSEFDDKKRSCRRRLSDHNARRRRVPPESVQLLSAGLSSALYDQRQQSLLLNGLPIPLLNSSSWEDANINYMLRQGLIIRPEGTLPYNSSDEIRKSISELHMDLDKLCPIQSSNQRLQIRTTSSPNAHSLLSSNPWSLNEGQSTTMGGGLVQGNYSNTNQLLMRKSNSEPFQSYSIINTLEQGSAVTMVHSVNKVISHQLFKADAHDSTDYSCSGPRNL